MRLAAKLTQDELAVRVGVKKAYISKMETAVLNSSGRGPSPPIEMLDSIARALKVELSEALAALGFDVKDDASELESDERVLLYMYRDLPPECRLDSLASIAGVHQRRSQSIRIVDRHQARATAREHLDSIKDLAERVPHLHSNAREVPKPEEIDISDLEAKAKQKAKSTVKPKIERAS